MADIKVFLDVECYTNYFLICFKSEHTVKYYEQTPNRPLDIITIKGIMKTYTTIGFNSNHYDLPMIAYALLDASCIELKRLSDTIITSKKSIYEVMKEFNLNVPKDWVHIDLIEPAPSAEDNEIRVGLKMYGARMHTRLLQDLPIEPNALIDPSQYELLRKYCFNDIDITMELYKQIEDRIELREAMGKSYNLELRSKSDAQVAEAIIKSILNLRKTNSELDTSKEYKYKMPDFLNFRSKSLINLCNELQTIGFMCDKKGRLIKDVNRIKTVDIYGNVFSVGIGGLHSNEKNQATTKNDHEFIMDVDVVSYYPTIILNNGYYPENIGERFLEIYDRFYHERIKAKKNKDKIKADTYKIILNGSFGKFGSVWSNLYSPSLLIHTTLTGQLSLLMLIETLILEGFMVISANTDGITIKGNKDRLAFLNDLLREWENITKFGLEKTNYKAIYHESVNTYIAMLENNEVKCKGIYASEGLTKNPTFTICAKAVIAYLKDGIDIKQTIYEGRNDIRKFLIVRKVAGGALYKDQYIGKIVRWYYGLNGDKIIDRISKKKVAASEGAIPLMDLSEKKVYDIDFQKYINIANEMLMRLGAKNAQSQFVFRYSA